MVEPQAPAVEGTRQRVRELVDGTVRVEVVVTPEDKTQFRKVLPELHMVVSLANQNADPDKVKPVLGYRGTTAERHDGSLIVKIDVPPTQGEQFFDSMPHIGAPVFMVACTSTTDPNIQASNPARKKSKQTCAPAPRSFGEAAKILHFSGFWFHSDVWEAIGTDEQFIQWTRKQKCAFRTSHMCSGPIEAAHVRRVEFGAGVGVKPPYATIPLCQWAHQQQHQHGESVIANPMEWENKRFEYVKKWGWARSKVLVGYESFSMVPPDEFRAWAEANNVGHHVPRNYQ